MEQMCINMVSQLDSAHTTFELLTVLLNCVTLILHYLIMDCVAAASDLKMLLVAHSNAETQVAVLGKLTFLFFPYANIFYLSSISYLTLQHFVLFLKTHLKLNFT